MTDELVERLRSIHTAADCDQAADRIEALTAERERLQKDAKAHEKEIAVWSENYAALERLRDACYGLRSIVEGIDGAMNHGVWRDENGRRLKDTPEWVRFYNATAALNGESHE